jgi:hypothetical protein
MAFTYTNSKGTTFYLNEKEVTLRGGKLQKIRYFTKDERKETAADLPEGFEVVENVKNGFCVVKRKK